MLFWAVLHGYLKYANMVLFVCQDMEYDKLSSQYFRFYKHPLQSKTKGYMKELARTF